jgi:hypothetical protein
MTAYGGLKSTARRRTHVIEIKPPEIVASDIQHPSLFLAGSIEMGAADHWQVRVFDAVNHPRLKAEAFDGRRKSQVYQTEV